MPALINAANHMTHTVLGDAYGASKTASYLTTAFDLQGYEGVVAITQVTNNTAGSSPTWAGKVQSATATGGSYADVAGATFTGATTTTAVSTVLLDVKNCNRFIKIDGTIGGTASPAYNVTIVISGVKKVQ